MGSYAFEHWIPDESALVVEKLLGAGAIMVGKTTTPEFAYSGFTESPLWGVTRNPWDPTRSPGGSSGGSAAAVASGCVPLAEGSDMGGSVRIPASWSGIVGLKPSFGRIPLDFLPTQFDTIQHFGPLARTVEDARLFLAVSQGPDERDIMSLSPPLDLSGPLDPSVEGMRLALDVDLGCFAVAPEVEASVTRGRGRARPGRGGRRGGRPRLGPGDRRRLGGPLGRLPGGDLRRQARRIPGADGSAGRGAHGCTASAWAPSTSSASSSFAHKAWKQLAPVLERFDALLCPTMSQTARPVDEDEFVWYAETRGRASTTAST